MKILDVLPSVNPELGGPAEAVRQRGLYLTSLGHVVEVLTLDDSRAAFLQNYPLPIHALGPSLPGYGYNKQLLPWLRARAQDFDAVVVEGLWQYHGFGTWRALRRSQVPYYVFAHGMLDPWFKHRYPLKHLKKWLYWPWAEYRVLRDAAATLFTTEQERLLARQSFWLYRSRERVVAFGTTRAPPEANRLCESFATRFPQTRGRRLLLFMGRIHEKKGCDLLIQAFARVATLEPQLHLVMAGPDQTGWIPTLQAMAASLGVTERITWPGMLKDDLKWGALYSADAFVLPSHQENFGIAVAEALACGVPVLISDKVNIWQEIQADGAGLVGADTVVGAESLLRRWLELDVDERARFREQARRTFESRFAMEATANDLLEVIRNSGHAAAEEKAVLSRR
jgi:glycosyltransferase involved in cell wall biosynthesis